MTPGIEHVVSAFRERVRGEIRFAPAWHDLDDDERVAAFDATLEARAVEAAADPEGLTGTAHAVLARIRRG